MIRTLITPLERNISLHLPNSFIGKKVEVIAFTLDETTVESKRGDAVLTHFASKIPFPKIG